MKEGSLPLPFRKRRSPCAAREGQVSLDLATALVSPHPGLPPHVGEGGAGRGWFRLRADLGFGEEERDLAGGVLRRVGPMHRVRLDRLREILADRARGSVGRVRRAHDLAVERDRVLALQHLDDHRSRDHERHEVAEERPLPVHLVEPLGDVLAELQPLLRDDAQAALLEAGVDLAGEVATRRVGLDDRERALGGHGRRLLDGNSRPYSDGPGGRQRRPAAATLNQHNVGSKAIALAGLSDARNRVNLRSFSSVRN